MRRSYAWWLWLGTIDHVQNETDLMSPDPHAAPGALSYETHGVRLVVIDERHVNVTRIADGHLVDHLRVQAAPGDGAGMAELADEWVTRRVGGIAPDGVTCSNCETVLRSATSSDTTRQYDNALWITFGGGYDMFIDYLTPEEQPEVVLCHACAHALCATVGWIGALLNPHESHAHRSDEIDSLLRAGHTGWDLERRM